MDAIKEKQKKKKSHKKIYVLLAIFAVFTIVFVGLGASGTLTNWIAKYEAKKNYETIIESASDVKDEDTLRQLLILDEELDITVNKDIEITTAFTVNGTKTLRGDATISADMSIFKIISIFNVSKNAKLIMDGLVLDGNAIANGITVEQGGELTYESGEIIYAGLHGITTSGFTTIEDVTISRSAVSAIDAAFGSEVYLKGGTLEDNANLAIYVEANAYMEVTGNPIITGTSHNAIRNRGEMKIFGGTFTDIGNYVIANHGNLLVEYAGSDDGYIEMTDIRQGVLYNNNTGTTVLRDIHASNMTLDGVKAAGGTVLVENCVFDTMSGNGIYMSAGEVTVKNTAFSNTGKCATYSLGGCKLNLEDVTFENIGTRGIMNKGGNVTGTNVTLKNVERFAVSNEKSGAGVVGTVDLINPHISECKLTNIYNTSEGTKLTITGGMLEESARTNVYATNGEVTLEGVEILGTTAKDKAAISIGEKGVVTLSGKSKIHGNGVRGVNISGIFNMTGGEIYGYNADTAAGGAVRLFTKGTFNMTGGTIHDNTTSYGGGAVYMGKNAVFNMKGGKIYNNAAKNNGGALQVDIGATFNMSGGTISNNKAQNYSGGAVYIFGKMNMSGGTIANNECATYGGAINLNKTTDKKTKDPVYGELVMTGGSITGNSSVNNGGAVNISSNTTFTMSGGSITGNTSKAKGSGVNQNGTFIVGGSASIKNNVVTLGGTSKVVTIKGDALSAHSTKEPLPIEPSFGAAKGTVLAKCESEDIASKVLGILAPGSKSYTSFGQLAETIVIGSYKETADMNMVGADTVYVSNYLELKEAVQSTTSKRNVIICANIEMEGVITVPDGCTVAIKDDGTTRVLSRADKNVGTFFRTNYGTGLSIAGTAKGKLVLDGEISESADASKVKQLLVVRGTTEVTNVTLKDNRASGETGALIRQHYGNMTVTSCTLSGAYGNTGGGIAVGTGTATIQSSTFNGNGAKYNGGAIRVEKNATVTVDSCKFKENTANSVGGAINSDVGTLIVKNSVFEGNSSKGTSGAINLTNNSTANITDSTFKGNSSTEDNAGAIKVNKSALVLENSTFEENTTTQSGGAIFLQGKIDEDTYSYVTATGCTFKENSAGKTGGAIKGETGVVITLNNSEFVENVIVREGTTGGAIDVYKSTVNATDVTFEKNASNTYGGAIYLNTGATANLAGCEFTENIAGKNGGAIRVEANAELNGEDCKFVGNNAVYNGGAVYVNASAKTTLENCILEANYTDEWSGGAVYNKGSFIATSCSFKENKAGSLEGVADVTNHGGAIDAYSNDTVLDNCTFSANESVLGADVYIRNNKTITMNGGTFTDSIIGYQTGSDMGKAIISGNFVGNVTFVYEYADVAGVVIGADGISGDDISITPRAYIKGHELITKTEDASEDTLKAAAKLIKITDNDDGVEWVIEADGTIDAIGTLQTNIAMIKETGVKYTSIKAALNAAQNGETIYVLYDMQLEKAITVSEGKNVIITNTPGKRVTIFRAFEGTLFTVESGSTLTLGSDTTEDAVGTFTVDGDDSLVALSLVNNAGTFNLKANATLQNANAGTSSNSDGRSYGGALYNTGIANLAGTFTENTGYNGGAIYNASGTLNIIGGIYNQNLASNKGGAIFVAKNTDSAIIANVEMTENDVTNKASQGVAIYLDGGSVANELTLENCNIHGNTVEYKDDTDCGSDVLLGDNTTLNLKDNINVGVLHQRYGYAVPNYENRWPYAVINVTENYTGQITIVPNNGNFTNAALGVGVAQIVNFDSTMTENEKTDSASRIVIRRVTDGVNDENTYCVDALGILQGTVVQVGDLHFLSLAEAIGAVTTEEDTTIYLLDSTSFSGTIAIGDADTNTKRTIILASKSDENVTITRAETGSMICVASNGSSLTIASGITLDGNKELRTPHLIKNEGNFILEKGATIQNSLTEAVKTNDEPYNGGALYNTGNATLKGSFTGCSAYNGGAVYNAAGATMEVIGSSFTNNVTIGGNGGAIRNLGILTVKNSKFEKNEAVSNNGGAIYTNTADFEATNTTFSGNTASKSGGAIYATGPNCTITNCDFSSNTAQGGTGGAIRAENSLTVTGGIYTGNKAATGGGAVDVSGVGIVSGVKMYDNSLTATSGKTFYGGGAIYVASGKELTLSDSNIYHNTSNYDKKIPSCDISNNGTLTLTGVKADDGDSETAEQCLVCNYKTGTVYYVASDGSSLTEK